MKDCQHKDYYYYPDDCNEAGWKCVGCGQLMPGDPPGFRPDLDRSEIRIKTGGLLHDLCDAKLVYVSNSSQGDYVESVVAERCTREGIYDQYSILLFLLEQLTPPHQKYWKEVSDGVIEGRDPRRRCSEGCGRLATVYADKDYCHEHSHATLPF
jgi:hypothetical protein